MSNLDHTQDENVHNFEHYVSLVHQLVTQRAIEDNRSLKFFVLTFGCQQNEADSEKLIGIAEKMGYVQCCVPEEADLIIVNTCAIREHAEQKALSTVGQYKHIKNKNPRLIIAVCGCMVVQKHRIDEIKHRYPYVDIVFGTSSAHMLPEFVYKRLGGSNRLFFEDEERADIREGLPVKREYGYKAWVSVMYGCNNFCSYCIVPYVRGRERSRCPDEILKEVRALVDDGYKDITLLGQNVNSYGKDLGINYDFADLVKDISAIDGDFKLRFMTSHPKDATFKLIDTLASSSVSARHFHLPLQSGSDRILKIMNRHYDTEKYLETVDYMRSKIPDITLTTDIIVGFPGETDEDFENTLDILRKVKFDMIFSFIYSPRKGTPAAEMENQVSADVKSRRFEKLLEVQKTISEEINKKFDGQVLRVLCDGISKTDNTVYSGRTEGNKIVFFKGVPADTGNFVNIKIERTEAFALYGHKTI